MFEDSDDGSNSSDKKNNAKIVSYEVILDEGKLTTDHYFKEYNLDINEIEKHYFFGKTNIIEIKEDCIMFIAINKTSFEKPVEDGTKKELVPPADDECFLNLFQNLTSTSSLNDLLGIDKYIF